ncbi:MAG TPA: Flp family type IVb pilin [Noviherbaspirillum sp.]|jgi:pilus assembly protein Flp/PilA|uniref:Flp family type IVb pilin n=1 Tax=Noviherbaspirillum sp. TaxID=1926288 RepID=UPI002F95DA4B
MDSNIWSGFKRGVMQFMRDEEGAAAVEYGLLAALIAVVVVVAVSAVGSQVCQAFKTIAERLGSDDTITCAAALS